jgi:hypothetical protein
MKKSLLLIITILFVTVNTYSQDFIYLKNGNRISANITESTKTMVLYSDFNSKDGSIKIVKNEDVKMIVFSSGKISNYSSGKSTNEKGEFKKNLFAYHLADLIINNLTISYERILNNGKIGLQIPFSIGYSDEYQELGDFRNKYYSGINLNFYPTGQGKWRFFTGPGIRIGSGTVEEYYYYASSNQYESFDVTYLKFHINNGVMYSPISELSIVASMALGIRYLNSNKLDENLRTTGAFSFNMIYKF